MKKITVQFKGYEVYNPNDSSVRYFGSMKKAEEFAREQEEKAKKQEEFEKSEEQKQIKENIELNENIGQYLDFLGQRLNRQLKKSKNFSNEENRKIEIERETVKKIKDDLLGIYTGTKEMDWHSGFDSLGILSQYVIKTKGE